MNPIQLNQVDAYSQASKNLLELYETEEGKKFVHHLIYAFFNESNFIIFSKNPLFDCLTKSVIIPVFDKDRPVKDPDLNVKLTEFKSTADENVIKEVNQLVKEYVSNNPTPRLAVRSNLSNRLLGQEELSALLDFVKSEIEKKNKVITDMIYYMKTGKKRFHKPQRQKNNKPVQLTPELIKKLQDKFNGQ